jgi:hypothetical protein
VIEHTANAHASWRRLPKQRAIELANHMQGPIIGIGPFNTFTLVGAEDKIFRRARRDPQRERSSEVCGCHQGGKGVRIGIWGLIKAGHYSGVVLSLIGALHISCNQKIHRKNTPEVIARIDGKIARVGDVSRACAPEARGSSFKTDVLRCGSVCSGVVTRFWVAGDVLSVWGHRKTLPRVRTMRYRETACIFTPKFGLHSPL